MQILALEQTIEGQNDLPTERQMELLNELTLKGQNELPAKGQNAQIQPPQDHGIDEIDGFDVSTWKRNDEGLLIPPDEASKVEVMCTCYDSGIAGH